MFVDVEHTNTLIIERARKLVNKLVSLRGHDKPPFLAEEFASLCGINEVVRTDLINVSAVLLKLHGGAIIQVNSKHHPSRQNFSVAHEIGHLLFSELKLERYINSIEYRTFNPQAKARTREKAIERLCDIAATELLMPELIFKKYLANFGLSVNSVEPLAHIFKTSIQATAFRIAEVTNEPCLMLMWQPFPVNNPKGLRLKRCVSSKTKLKAVPIHTLDKFPSSLSKAYNSNMSVKSNKKFIINNTEHFIPMESKGFGYGEYRYVLSLAFLNKVKLGDSFAE
ncbi:MAG: ImmA/IrrE family metallo-endopeptidase [Chloroflexi bacterium]|nr:ImmA/IrrE family metallo-endopeptidase [Chloroflexota bacterium]